jgi:preprotein translocase subunit YajC
MTFSAFISVDFTFLMWKSKKKKKKKKKEACLKH